SQPNAPGLSTLLAGTGTLDETVGEVHIMPRSPGNGRIRSQSVVSYSMLSSGAPVPNPGALLGRPAFANLLSRATEHFDTVVVDSGAIVPVSDSAPLARRCDAILLVADRGRTTPDEIEEARRALGPLYQK